MSGGESVRSDAAVDLARRRLLVAAAATPLLISTGQAAQSAPKEAGSTDPIARTSTGEFVGIHRDGIDVFLGIRYGHSPAARRFQPPLPIGAATSRIRAQTLGPICPQRTADKATQNEDCLCLNIWTPSADSRAKRSVMVYIHGGAYATGSGNDPLTDGTALALRGDVVVVTITHRLNVFGYLSLARIGPRFPDSGNVGQLDLILALRWVRDHIGAFGGDARNVMVFGQSGGGAKIATLMGTPAAAGLFHKAATMSGQQVTASGPLNASKRARAYLAALGSDPAAASPEALVAALDAQDPILSSKIYFGPVLDGRTLLRHPFYPDAHPQSRSVPMMLGNTVAETAAFFPLTHAKLRDLSWLNLAERLGPELVVDISPEAVVEKYRQWFPEKSATEVFIAATTAGRSWRGQVIEAEARAMAGSPAYVYQLNFENAAHMADIGLVFGTRPSMNESQRAMSTTMMDAFIAFAKTGSPGWPAYELSERKTMVFDAPSRIENDPRGRERIFFSGVPYVQPGS